MKNYFKTIVFLALIITLATESQQSPKKTYRKQNTKAVPRQAHKPRPAVKKPIVKTDKELLRDQIALLSDDFYQPSLLLAVNNNRELKDFCYKNVCPIRNWTKQDQINTAIWIRKVYTIIKKGSDKKNVVMPTPSSFCSSLVYGMFMKSPCYLNLTENQRYFMEENQLDEYVDTLVERNMKTDLKDVKPMDKNIFPS